MPAGRWTQLLDALYALDVQQRDWVASIADAARRAFDEGEGAAAYTWGMVPGPSVGLVGGDDEIARLPLTIHDEMPPELVRLAYGSTPRSLPVSWAWATPAGPRLPPHFARELRGLDLMDGYAVLGSAGHEGLAIGLGIPRRRLLLKSARAIDSLNQRWGAVAHHAAIAYRLRKTLGADAPANHRLDTRGAVTEPDLWELLLEGLWSVVKVTRRDGAVQWVVVKNPPDDTLRVSGKTEREVVERALTGQPLKAIAIDLGLAESSIATALSRALSRLGVQSLTELQRLKAGLQGARK